MRGWVLGRTPQRWGTFSSHHTRVCVPSPWQIVWCWPWPLSWGGICRVPRSKTPNYYLILQQIAGKWWVCSAWGGPSADDIGLFVQKHLPQHFLTCWGLIHRTYYNIYLCNRKLEGIFLSKGLYTSGTVPPPPLVAVTNVNKCGLWRWKMNCIVKFSFLFW